MNKEELIIELQTALRVYLNAGDKEQRKAASIIAKKALSHKLSLQEDKEVIEFYSLTDPRHPAYKYLEGTELLDKLIEMKSQPSEGVTDEDLLHRLIEYMESRADADGDSEGMYPNEEMGFFNELVKLLHLTNDKP